ncbi:hypothetical protein PENTCL1PPCAC_4869, partial [Pristionchus entomophagus]
MLTLTDHINLGVVWTLDMLAICLNLLLIGVIVLRTPVQLRTYSVFLLNNAIIDLTTAISSALASTRIIINHETQTSLFVFLGPCTLFSEHLCRLCQALLVNLVTQSSIVLLISFLYRLYIIDVAATSRSPLSSSRIWLFCSISFLLITPLTYGYYLEETDVSQEVLNRFDLHGYTVSNYNIFSTRSLVVNSVVCVISPIVFMAIFVVRRMLIARISQAVS